MKMHKIKKWLISTALSLTMTVGLATPAMAADLREEKAAAEADLAVAEASAAEEFKLNLSAVADVDEEEVELTDEDGDTVEMEEEATTDDLSTDMDGVTDSDESSETGTSAASVDGEAAKEAAQKAAMEEAASKGLYIKELRLSIKPTEWEAKGQLEYGGYTVIDQNLNPDASGEDARVVYLGYKTTEDVSEAVRDIATMDLTGSYIITDYESVMLEQYETFAPLEKNYAAILKEFREKYNKRSPYALASYEMLNMFYEDDTNQKLGDYLLTVDLSISDGKTISELAQFVTGISNGANTFITNLLGYGLVSYEGNNFLQKLSDMSNDEIAAAMTDRGLGDTAKNLEDAMSTYAESLSVALENPDADGSINEETLDVLDSLTYQGDTLLDYFSNEDIGTPELMPLAKTLSEGQIAVVEMAGMEFLIEWESKNLLAESTQKEASIEDEIKDFKKDFQNQIYQLIEDNDLKTNENGLLSIYYGVDRSLMQGTIAMTEEAANYAKASATNPFRVAAGTALFVSAMAILTSASLIAATMFWNKLFVRSIPSNMLYYAAAAAAVAVVFYILYQILEMKADEQYEVEKIPDVLIEKRTDADGTPYFVRYQAVNSFETYRNEPVPGDLNGGIVERGLINHHWDVLYVSTEIDAGEPIQAIYKAASSAKELSENYFLVHHFGSDEAYNLNEYSDSWKARSVYLSFKSGVADDFAGSIFGSSTGRVAIFIIGILLGAALMAVAQALGRRRRKAVA